MSVDETLWKCGIVEVIKCGSVEVPVRKLSQKLKPACASANFPGLGALMKHCGSVELLK